MTYSKTIPMHKRLASGEPVTGMKHGGKPKGYKDGGAVRGHEYAPGGPPFKKGGKVKKSGKEC